MAASTLTISPASLIDYYFARPGQVLPGVDEKKLLDYVLAANGVFIRGRRPGLEVCIQMGLVAQRVRGLSEMPIYVQFGYPKVPAKLLKELLRGAWGACAQGPREVLYWLAFGECCRQEHAACGGGWHALRPEQETGPEHCRPLDPDHPFYQRALIELHSHNVMRADFSETDDADDANGFRIYAVLGDIWGQPTLRARVGLFGHFLEYPASEFFELPDGLIDCLKEDR